MAWQAYKILVIMPGASKHVAGPRHDKRHQALGNIESLRATMWKPGQSGNPLRKNVRAKNTKYLRKIGYTQGEINDAIIGMLAMTTDELTLFTDRPDATTLERTIGNALLTGARKGTLWNLDTLLTRVHGMPKQSMEVEQKGVFEVTLNLGGKPNNGTTENNIPPALGSPVPG